MFGFDGQKPKPADPKAQEFAAGVVDLMQAHTALEEAKKRVPDYTGQWAEEDYYANEQEAYNRAADSLYELVK